MLIPSLVLSFQFARVTSVDGKWVIKHRVTPVKKINWIRTGDATGSDSAARKFADSEIKVTGYRQDYWY